MTVSFARMTLQGGAFILVAALLRALLSGRLPRRALVWLWIAALARLLLPVGLPLYTRPASTPAPGLAVALTGGAAAVAEGSGGFPILRAAYLAVAAGLAAYFALSHLRARRALRFAENVEGGDALLPALSRPLRRRVALKTLPGLPTPVTCGVLRPVIVMPGGAGLEKPAARCAMLHELCHVRRFDTLLRGISALALCLHWFNPAVWLLYAMLSRDMEIACDEAALSELSGDGRREYALALLTFRAARDGLRPGGVAFGGIADEERIRCVMKFKRKTFLTVVLSLALVIAGFVIALAAEKAPPAVPETSAEPEPSSGPLPVVLDLTGDGDGAESGDGVLLPETADGEVRVKLVTPDLNGNEIRMSVDPYATTRGENGPCRVFYYRPVENAGDFVIVFSPVPDGNGA